MPDSRIVRRDMILADLSVMGLDADTITELVKELGEIQASLEANPPETKGEQDD
jgi:hypothetical protein